MTDTRSFNFEFYDGYFGVHGDLSEVAMELVRFISPPNLTATREGAVVTVTVTAEAEPETRAIALGEIKVDIVNLTPHAINVHDDERHLLVVIPPSGMEARIQTEKILVEVVNLDGLDVAVPLYRTAAIGDATGLPAPQPHTIYVVSGMFRAYRDRLDLYQPGELIRDQAGQPIGCIGLSR